MISGGYQYCYFSDHYDMMTCNMRRIHLYFHHQKAISYQEFFSDPDEEE